MKNRILYIFSMVVLTLSSISFVTCAYLALIPVTVLQSNIQPYTVITKTIKAGEPVVYEVNACKYKDLTSTVVRRFVDTSGLIYPLPPEQNNVKPGCNITEVPVLTPESLHPGKWKLTLDVSYQVNPLRTESYHLSTETFTIQ